MTDIFADLLKIGFYRFSQKRFAISCWNLRSEKNSQHSLKTCLRFSLCRSVLVWDFVKFDRVRLNYGKGSCRVIKNYWMLWEKIAGTVLNNVLNSSHYASFNRKLRSVFEKNDKNWICGGPLKRLSRDHCVNNGFVVHMTRFPRSALSENIYFGC